MKNLINNGEVLSREEQKEINGGFGFREPVVCLDAYAIPNNQTLCLSGYYMHPAMAGVCCRYA